MKKLLIAAAMFFATVGVFAQTQPKKNPKDKAAKPAATATAKKAPATMTTAAKPAITAGPTKKDGTADMRFKANKDAKPAAVAGPLKKDGTADMRYKANKTTAGKKKKS